MILNQKQYGVTKSLLKKLKASFSEVIPNNDVDPIIVAAHKKGLESDIADLQSQLEEYEKLTSKSPRKFQAKSLNEIPTALIKTRISLGLSQEELADLVGLKKQQIQRYEADSYRSTNIERLELIAEALGVGIVTRLEVKSVGKDAQTEIPFSQFPVTEMARKGWFEDFPGTPLEARKQANTLVPAFLATGNYSNAAEAYHRKSFRQGAELNLAALLAWEARVRTLAERQTWLPSYSSDNLDKDWITSFVSLSRLDNGPIEAVEKLNSIGIRFVFVSHLKGTHLDGGVMKLQEGDPCIAMTLRHDRIDNFWFTLLHEIGHIKHHLYADDVMSIFDDLDHKSDSEIENEADEFATEALIPSRLWAKCLSRFSMTSKSVMRDAAKLSIHPAIIAGRIRREKSNYAILSEIVGNGKVRHFFENKEQIDEH